jgi:hypothetical protein
MGTLGEDQSGYQMGQMTVLFYVSGGYKGVGERELELVKSVIS